MTPATLLADFRTTADDKVTPYLVDDDVVYSWMAEAERETCVRAKLIYDETTPAICRAAVVPGQTRYGLDPRLVEVDAVWLDRPATGMPTFSQRMFKVDQSNARRRDGAFLYSRENVDSYYAHRSDYGNDWDGGNGAIRLGSHLKQYSIDGQSLSLYTIPDTTFTSDPAVFRICVYRLPLEPVAGEADDFEIPEVHQDGLLHWLLYRFYSLQDADASMDSRAQLAHGVFESRYGPRQPANAIRMQSEGRSWQTAYGGY